MVKCNLDLLVLNTVFSEQCAAHESDETINLGFKTLILLCILFLILLHDQLLTKYFSSCRQFQVPSWCFPLGWEGTQRIREKSLERNLFYNRERNQCWVKKLGDLGKDYIHKWPQNYISVILGNNFMHWLSCTLFKYSLPDEDWFLQYFLLA